jgi:hypothetical protein
MINHITVPAPTTLRHLLTLSLLALLGSVVSVAPLHAGVLFTFSEVGSDVVATTSGSIAAGWSRPGGITTTSASTRTLLVNNSLRYEIAGAARFTQSSFNSAWTNNNLMNGVSTLGIETGVGSGDAFGFSSVTNFYAPAGTNVGDAITPNTTITWANETYESLGLDTGLSTTPLVLFTLDNSETISAVRGELVPEPASIAFMATGGLAAGVVAVARRRRRTGADS